MSLSTTTTTTATKMDKKSLLEIAKMMQTLPFHRFILREGRRNVSEKADRWNFFHNQNEDANMYLVQMIDLLLVRSSKTLFSSAHIYNTHMSVNMYIEILW